MVEKEPIDLDTSKIKEWKSIVTLLVFIITTIGRKEVHDGTIGANHISPIEIMAFFLTLAYIAISIDASGLIRYLAFKVLQKGGGVGHRLFFYLFIGNDPIILSGTAFLAYMTPEAQAKAPVNPNIPNARGLAEEQEKSLANDEEGQLLSLEEIMNPFLDKGGAAFGAVLMAATLVTILAVNAASPGAGKERPVYEITLPAAFIMFVWDIGFGWHHRRETRKIAQDGRQEVEYARAEAAALKEMRDEEEEEAARLSSQQEKQESTISQSDSSNGTTDISNQNDKITIITDHTTPSDIELSTLPTTKPSLQDRIARHLAQNHSPAPATLTTLLSKTHRWSQETFPTCTAVVAHLPFALVPFAFAMFILVQALVTKGWVPVFAYGWDHWVSKTGTVGSIAGMGFLSVILCNFAGTNIGTTILLSRVIQSWEEIHKISGVPITDRTFWATVYAMAIGVNYGAFSTAFSASLAGLLWRDILARKHIRVRRLDFARVNLPIIAIAMVVGCVVLVGQVYVVRGDKGHVPIR
ncbi:hypothetical protein M7I_0096 [Glarea lozoyensis 74030]|uniref:Arsenical pump membrane protein n=1 Tax=Glarea lozoyensis (strain ATCC 74030 / MF5533) TaxID=1104152 RepID=H0ECF8_GLAL7|nr:hypothetical protein M7I_0096 [Glarea lozoyensis 74030]